MDQLDPRLAAFADALLPDYRVQRVLGKGGMATVFLAEEPALKREVAIKVLAPALAEDASARKRFRREGEAAASLSHPHIVPIHRVGEAAGLPFLVMQYVRGESLADRMAREGQLAPDEALRLTREIAGALRAAHRRGIVHRDVKPQNVLLEGEDGRALVTDFGIARLVSTEADADPATRDVLTGVGNTIGTPRYMSPEQAGAQPVGPPSDLYSLGVVLYEMLAGAPPYAETEGRSALLQHLVDPVVPLAERRPDVSAEVTAVTERLLEKDPAARYASADDLLTALGPAGTVSGATPAPAAVATGRPRSRRGLLAGALGTLAAVVAAAAFLLRGGPAEDPRQSLLVGYFENTADDPDLAWLRVGGIELLNRSLSRWDDLRLVETTRLLDLARRADLEEGATLSRDDALALAKEAGVGTLALGSVLRLGGGQSSVSLRLYDVASGETLQQFTREVAADSALPAAFAGLADDVLDLAGVPPGAVPADAPPTRSLAAFRAYVDGLRAIHRFELDSARAAMETAVALDPDFALAWVRMAEAALFRDGPFPDTAPWERMADSAMARADGRPERERLWIETAWHFMHGRHAEARASARRTLQLDSSSVDGWSYLGISSLTDRFVHADAAGRDSTGYDPTTGLRAIRRAIALDASNAQHYFFLNMLLWNLAREAPGEPVGREWLSREPPGRILPRFVGAPAVAIRLLMVSEDSIAVAWPGADEPAFTSALEAASLRLARATLRQYAEPWLAVAPDEAMPHQMMAFQLETGGDFEGALAEFERAAALAPETSAGGLADPDWERLRLALRGRLDSVAFAVAARLEALGDSMWLSSNAGLPDAGPRGTLGAAQLLAGRLEAATVTFTRAEEITDEAFALRGRPRPQSRFRRAFFDAQLRAIPGRLRREELAGHEAALRRGVATLPDSLQSRASLQLIVPLGFAAAYRGDTAMLRRLRAEMLPRDRELYPGLEALAAAVSGDRSRALEALDAVDTDTLYPWPGSFFSAGEAALRLGEPERALVYFARVDSAALSLGNAPVDSDWIFVPRAAKGRGDAAYAMGDSARAVREYERVLRLWANADPVFHPERDEAAARLAELTGTDQVRRVPVPGGG